jgi:hypothetical protein
LNGDFWRWNGTSRRIEGVQMSEGLAREARGYVRNRTEEPQVRPCGTNMGHPEQTLIQERGETAATYPGEVLTRSG